MMTALFLLVSAACIGGVELLKRWLGLSAALTRRMTHVGAASIAAISPYFLDKQIIIAACLAFALLVYLGRRTTLLSSIHAVGRTSYGDVCLPLGEALAAALFLPQSLVAFQCGVLVMGFADAAAGFVGERYGKHPVKLLGASKTLEGSGTFFVMTCLILAFFVPGIGPALLCVAALLTVLEALSGYGIDNLVLPVATGLLIVVIAL